MPRKQVKMRQSHRIPMSKAQYDKWCKVPGIARREGEQKQDGTMFNIDVFGFRGRHAATL